ncbi:M20 metallopeptidase family protein [Goodfellowiella coeruleoviolacea]|uniref:Amidohydrolase n=1 Tax=Goodfellowiella coeruleoviolacea TaxID=334858 RepID=A0AAE3KMJ8_9PSEU|nr:amidohydrolase [Goodfellowiella coeruleoviolacea]MCP2167693.1 amidohydrolase [Goodfellowiella coeruleoviolacea]
MESPRLAPRTTVSTEIDQAVTDLWPRLVDWRRHLHRHPELSFRERETARYIGDHLSALGLDVAFPVPTAVVGRLRTGRPGPTLALRADIDAIAVTEDSGLDYASVNPGVMHACGHDGHVAVLLGVASVLHRLRDLLRGEIRLIFQHGEEQVPSGAPELVEAGVLDGVQAIIGQHLWAPLEVGRVCVRPGPLMASTDYFEVLVHGKGGHAGLPHQTVDPLAVAAQVVTSLNHLVARETDPQDSLVVSVTRFHAGETINVIADRAALGGTIRALDERVRQAAPGRIERVVHGVAEAFGARAEVSFRFGPPAVDNDRALVDSVAEAVRRQLGEDALTHYTPVMGGDDFSFYQQHVPGVYLLVGAGVPGADNPPHHHPAFRLDERALAHAARVLADAAAWFCDRERGADDG